MSIPLMLGWSCRAQDAGTSSGPKDQGYNRFNQRTAGSSPRWEHEVCWFDTKGQGIGSRGPSVVIGISLERKDEVRKERKAKSTNCWTLGYIKKYWEVSIWASLTPEHVASHNVFHVLMLRKCNSDARQIGAYERIDMQPDVTYMEQPGRVIDWQGTSA